MTSVSFDLSNLNVVIFGAVELIPQPSDVDNLFLTNPLILITVYNIFNDIHAINLILNTWSLLISDTFYFLWIKIFKNVQRDTENRVKTSNIAFIIFHELHFINNFHELHFIKRGASHLLLVGAPCGHTLRTAVSLALIVILTNLLVHFCSIRYCMRNPILIIFGSLDTSYIYVLKYRMMSLIP